MGTLNVLGQTSSDEKIEKFFDSHHLRIFLGPGIGIGYAYPDRLVSANGDLSVCLKKNVFVVNVNYGMRLFAPEDYSHQIQDFSISYGRFYVNSNYFFSGSIGAGYAKENRTINPYFFEYESHRSIGLALNGKALVSFGEEVPFSLGLNTSGILTPESFFISGVTTLMIRIP